MYFSVNLKKLKINTYYAKMLASNSMTKTKAQSELFIKVDVVNESKNVFMINEVGLKSYLKYIPLFCFTKKLNIKRISINPNRNESFNVEMPNTKCFNYKVIINKKYFSEKIRW